MEPSTVLILTVSTLGLIVGLAISYAIHSQTRLKIVASQDAPLSTPAPRVSVIVPARNEARNIRRCVTALLAQDYPDFELIVVDDRSTDATPQILAELMQEARNAARLQVLQGGDLPAGWAGKPHALHTGAVAANGEWLCFVDADTFASRHLLRATVSTANHFRADLFTILTDQELGSFWEKVILPLVFTALSFGFPAERVNDPSRPEAIANGQFILIRQAVYASIGGHAAVRNEIAEDKALADLVKRSGYRLVVADGRGAASTRMYTSLPEIWEGWTKNIYLGMRERVGLLLFGAMTGLLGALVLPLWLLMSVAWLVTSGGTLPAVVAGEALVVWGYLVWIRIQASRAFRISPWYALTLPLGALIFTAMMFTSAFNVLSGKGVTWKGRTYS